MKYNVEKSTTIEAPTNQVRSLIEDFKHWNSWSPWTIVEPDCPITINGQPNKQGHSMFWDGEIIGSGQNTLRSSDNRGIYYDLEFFKPWKSQAKTSFLFEDMGKQTKVTWTMDSTMPFFLFFMVKTMKNWIGMDYERGLRMLKEMAEKQRIDCKTTNNGIIDYKGFSYVGIKRTTTIADMPNAIKQDFERLVNDIVVEKQKSAMHWLCIYPKFDMKNMTATYIAAVSDENLKNENLGSNYVNGNIKDSKMLEIKHDGSYEFLGNAWSMGMMVTRAKKYKCTDFPFEQYWNSPMETPPEELKTSIYFPIKG